MHTKINGSLWGCGCCQRGRTHGHPARACPRLCSVPVTVSPPSPLLGDPGTQLPGAARPPPHPCFNHAEFGALRPAGRQRGQTGSWGLRPPQPTTRPGPSSSVSTNGLLHPAARSCGGPGPSAGAGLQVGLVEQRGDGGGPVGAVQLLVRAERLVLQRRLGGRAGGLAPAAGREERAQHGGKAE